MKEGLAMTSLSAIQMLEEEFRYVYQCLLKQAEMNQALVSEINQLKKQLQYMKGEN